MKRVGEWKVFRGFTIEWAVGPWLSFGIHVDWQARNAQVFFVWWVITFGLRYHDREQERA